MYDNITDLQLITSLDRYQSPTVKNTLMQVDKPNRLFPCQLHLYTIHFNIPFIIAPFTSNLGTT